MLDDEYFKALQERGQGVNPLFAHLGATLDSVSREEVRLRLAVSKYLLQGAGVVAGGILATMADECMAHAVMSVLESEQSIVTAEMNIRYLRAADPDKGGELIAWAEIVKRGHKLTVASATVHDSDGRLLATAGATFYIHSSARVE